MKVPFLDLKAHHAPIREELDKAIKEVIDAGTFASGPFVERFEKDFGIFCEAHHTIGVGSGTEALWLSLLATGIGQGDEVITVPNTFIATAEAITYCGARPVLVDVDPDTYTMDPNKLEEAITGRTRAIIPVHLFGQPADMDPLVAIARSHGLYVIEDACQAHGATYKGRKVGTLGDTGCFSFYPGKNLGAFGEAGAITTNNAKLDTKIRILLNHGQIEKYRHTMIGWNCRMDEIQASVLRVKLRYLESANKARIVHAKRYDRLLKGIEGIVLPTCADYAQHVYHLYAIRVQNRDDLLRFMSKNGIECGVHYPIPIHQQIAYQKLGYPFKAFKVASRYAQELVSLPMFPELTDEQIETVSESIKKATVLLC